MPRLADLPPESRPRERLLELGAHVLEPPELLALVLGTGRGTEEDVLELANRVLLELGGIEALAAADCELLRSIRGIGPVKASRIRAALELALRAGPVEPPAQLPEPDPLAAHVERLRGQIAIGERAVLAYRPQGAHQPLSLALGAGIAGRPPGSWLARMLEPTGAPWWLVELRSKGAPSKREREAVGRIVDASALLGVDLRKVVFIAGQKPHVVWAA